MTQAVPTSAYPTGVRALLPQEARRRRTIESGITESLEANRFEEIVLPMIDFVDPYAEVFDRDLQRRSYRFTDREGELITVRSDFTPMVARALAPSLRRADLPLRVFYRGDVIRCEATRLGTNREFFQIGAEIIGDGSEDADFEMLALAVGLVERSGIEPVVVLTDSSMVTRLMDSAASSQSDRAALRSALCSRRAAVLEDLAAGMTAGYAALFRRIAAGRATLEDFLEDPGSAPAAARLTELQRRAEKLPATIVVSVDDLDEDSGYYTGPRFRIFAPRSRVRLAQGGRYDQLYSRFGADAPAIGFTITVDYIDAELEGAGRGSARGEGRP